MNITFQIVYLLVTMFIFIGARKTYKINFNRLCFLFLICLAGLVLALINFKIYVLMGFSVACVIAMVYTITHSDQKSSEIMDQAGINLKTVLITCIVSLFFWPQLVIVNIYSVVDVGEK